MPRGCLMFFLMLRQRWKSMKKLVRKNIILRQFWKLGFKTNSSCKQLHRPLILFVSVEKWTLSTHIHIQPHPSTSKLWKVWIFSKIWMVFGKKFPTNTNTNTIRQKISTEYEYEYYSVWKYHRIRIRIISYSNIFEYIPIYSNIFKHRIIPSLMKSHAKKLFEILAFFVTFFPWKKKQWTI